MGRIIVALLAILTTIHTLAQDDHGDEPVSATLLPIGGTLPGEIDSSRDVDVFRVDLPGVVAIEARTTGQTDTSGELLDYTGARLVADEDAGPGDNFSVVSNDLEPGAYYVLVSGEPGPYAVNVRLADALDHGAVFEASTLLKLHTEEDLAGVSPQVLLATSGRIYPDTDDTDMFRLDLTGEVADVTVRASGAVDTYATLYRPDGTELAFSDNGTGNFNINMPLAGGIYYVAVKGYGTGAYRVLASRKPTDETPGSTLMLPAPRFHDETATGLQVSWDWTFAPLEQVSFDFQGRVEGMEFWPLQACFEFVNPLNQELHDTLTAILTQLEPDTTYEARYRFRDTEECSSAPGPDSLWSAIGSGTTSPPDTTSADEHCRDGDTIDAGNQCSLYDTSLVFEARTNGTGCLVGGGLLSCAGNRHNIRDSTINGIRVTFVAERNDDDGWTIEDVEPEPDNGESVSVHARSAVRQ